MSTALIVVDVQNDFCPGGSLPVDGGDEVAATISRYLASTDRYRSVVATMDWHPGGDTDPDFAHFAAEPDFVTTWPAHCVAGTEGADLHADLTLPDSAVIVRKGQAAAAYSGFEGHGPDARSLWQILRSRKTTHVDVVGLATDYCVTATAIDARALGFAVRVLLPATAGISRDTTERSIEQMRSLGIEVADHLPDGQAGCELEPG